MCLKKRLSLGLQRCSKVSQRGFPHPVSSRLLLSSCFPKAGFGVELLSPTKRDFANFRTVSSRAMGLAKKGSSPWIALNLTDKNLDFECFSLTRTLFFWRKYLKVFPNRKLAVLAKLVDPPKTGPISNFVSILGKIGTIGNNGQCIRTSMFHDVDWIHCSKSFLRFVIQSEWNHQVCAYMTKLPRKNFHCEATDLQGFQRVFRKYTPIDQQIIRTHVCGAHYTLNAKSKYLEVDNTCPFCDQPDSRSHRILSCTGLVNERRRLSQTTIAALNENPTLCHFGIPTLDFGIASLRTCLGYPDFASTPVPPEFNHCPEHCEIPHIFTDGSCFHNKDRLFSLAGCAFQAYSNVGDNEPFMSHRCLLPGQDHTSFRAEVYSLLLVCTYFKKCVIYIDCQAAKSDMIYFLENISNGFVPVPEDHCDIWNIIIQIVRQHGHSIRLIKVKAHAEHQHHSDPFVSWCCQCNSRVDFEAKQAVVGDHPELYRTFTTQIDNLCVQRISLGEILEFQVQTARRAFVLTTSRLREARAPTVFAKGVVPTCNLVSWDCQITEELSTECKFNPVFLVRIATWASSLRWSIASPDHISYFELMLSYIFDTRMYPPFPVRKYPHKPDSRQTIWILKDQEPLRDFQGKHVGDLLSGFVRCINWAEKHLNIPIFPGEHKPDITSLSKYGYKGLKVAGFKSRAVLPQQDEVDNYCNKFLNLRKALDSPIP